MLTKELLVSIFDEVTLELEKVLSWTLLYLFQVNFSHVWSQTKVELFDTTLVESKIFKTKS